MSSTVSATPGTSVAISVSVVSRAAESAKKSRLTVGEQQAGDEDRCSEVAQRGTEPNDPNLGRQVLVHAPYRVRQAERNLAARVASQDANDYSQILRSSRASIYSYASLSSPLQPQQSAALSIFCVTWRRLWRPWFLMNKGFRDANEKDRMKDANLLCKHFSRHDAELQNTFHLLAGV